MRETGAGLRWSTGRSHGQRDATDDAEVAVELDHEGRAVVTVSLPPGVPDPVDAVVVAGRMLDGVIALELVNSSRDADRQACPAIRPAA